MDVNYHDRGLSVNQHCCFTINNAGCTLADMTLGERIQLARKHARMTQGGLAEAAGVSQQAISRLETGEQKTTTDIVQIAVACGVRPEWLAMEEGAMVDGFYVHDERLKRALALMQELPDYALDEAIKGIDSVAKLTRRASGEHK